MRTLKWLIGGAALAWVVGGVIRRANLATWAFPFLPGRRSPVAEEMFHVAPGEPHDPPPGSAVSSSDPLGNQQHVDASYREEHGHPKR